MTRNQIGRRDAIGKISFAGAALLVGSRCGDGTATTPSESSSSATTPTLTATADASGYATSLVIGVSA
jgi:hypothetical protein